MNEFNQIENFMGDFESFKEYAPNGVEIWRASNYMKILGYNRYNDFEVVIRRSMDNFDGICVDLCSKNGISLAAGYGAAKLFDVNLHYIQTTRQFNSGRNRVQETPDYYLTRLACYAIAMEADNRKPQVKLAKQYLLLSVLENEKRKQYLQDQQRIDFRNDMVRYENALEHTYAEHGVKPSQFGFVKSQGDVGFYDNPNGTSGVKKELGVPNNQPLYDYMPFETMAFKAMGNIGTKYGIINNNLVGAEACANEAFNQNSIQRQKMKEMTGLYPEDTMPIERISTTKKNVKSVNQNIVKGSLEDHLPDNIDPRVYNLIFEYYDNRYTLGQWCYMNNIDPLYTLSLIDSGIPFDQAIFMRPNNATCPILFT